MGCSVTMSPLGSSASMLPNAHGLMRMTRVDGIRVTSAMHLARSATVCHHVTRKNANCMVPLGSLLMKMT
eukprot:590230-Amphidinium_carterae.4